MEDGISINMYFCRSGQHKPDIIKFDPNEYGNGIQINLMYILCVANTFSQIFLF